MGICGGKLTDEDRKNREIDKGMMNAKKIEDSKIKLLLLGAGESGKTTLFKQMRLLYSESKQFTVAEKNSYTDFLYQNIVIDALALVAACESARPQSAFKSPEAHKAAQEIKQWNSKGKKLTVNDAELLKSVWNDINVQDTWENRGDVQVQDAFEYFMSHIDRICALQFEPTNDDILRVRVRTSGVVKESFKIDSTRFEMFDVGGQRNERRKWIHQFDGVTTLLFVAAVSEYNQVLFEDSSRNRQQEAVELYKSQLDSPYFVRTPIILFLNKNDLFREKLPKIPFRCDIKGSERNTDFEGKLLDMNRNYKIDGSDEDFEVHYEAVCEYMKRLYQGQAPEEKQHQLYTYFTNSTDTANIEHIMTTCKDIILKENLKAGGWLTDI